MSVCGRAVFVSLFAMFARRSCVLLGFFLLAHRMVLLGLMMMMGGSVVVRGGEVMVLSRRMMLRFMRHWTCLLGISQREPTFLKQAG